MQWEDEGAAIVERAWVQTWLTASVRQDRAVFQFSSGRKVLEVSLPAGVAPDQIGVRLDGKPTAAAVEEGVLTIPLPGGGEQGRHLLELGYQFADRPAHGAMSLELPRLGRNAWVRRMYWQLILPRNEHLLISPSSFAGEYAWGWGNYAWGRRPLLDQAQLEDWVGAAHHPRPAETNDYLFSTFGNVECAAVCTASRSWIVLLASGAALAAGLVLIYLPRSRRPAALWTAAVALAALGVLYPEPAWLAAQAAGSGLLLALAAALLARGVARHRPVDEISELTAPRLDSGLTPLPIPPRAPPASGSTSTKNLAAAAPAPRNPRHDQPLLDRFAKRARKKTLLAQNRG